MPTIDAMRGASVPADRRGSGRVRARQLHPRARQLGSVTTAPQPFTAAGRGRLSSNRLMLRDGSLANLRAAARADRAAIARSSLTCRPSPDIGGSSRPPRSPTRSSTRSARSAIRRVPEDSWYGARWTMSRGRSGWRRTPQPVRYGEWRSQYDRFQWRGLATAMLEQLAGVAASTSRLVQAMTAVDNEAMLEVFRDSDRAGDRDRAEARSTCGWIWHPRLTASTRWRRDIGSRRGLAAPDPATRIGRGHRRVHEAAGIVGGH